ncbi:MAG: autoinducer 2 ABC transporter substrate-binding protein [Spirochaetia bacterium]
MKRTMVIVASLVLACMLAVPVFAQSYDPMKFKSSKPQSAWKIALVPKDATNAWFVRMEVGVKQFAKDTGINAFQKGPAKTDAAMQVQVIEDLIAQGVDAICVVPVDPSALEPVLGEALSKGIVVIDHEGATQQNTLYDIEAFSNEGLGQTIMQELAKMMGEKGLYTTMVGNVTNASHNEWADAGVAYQKAHYPNMTLLAAEPRVEIMDNLDTAYQRAKELFKKYPNLKGIFGTSSLSVPGTARAIEELGLQGRAFVTAVGLPNECAPFIKDGTVDGVLLWDPKDAGYAQLAMAVAVLKGEKVANGINLKAPGWTNMKFKPGSTTILQGQGWITINKANVDTFGF